MPAKKVFVACPIGSENSSERAQSDHLMKFVIYPAVKELLGNSDGQSIVRADTMGEPGRITTQILRELVSADVVIADVTGTNPNVMYEVGIRQAIVKPLVLMAESSQKLPFDLSDLRTVFYKLDLEHFERAQNELKAHLEKAFAGAVSPLDKALFLSNEGQLGGTPDGSRDLLAVLEVCEGILKETQETKDLVTEIGRVAIQIQGTKEDQREEREEATRNQLGMMFMNQFMQNPDMMDKMLPAMQKLQEFGQHQQLEQKLQKGTRRRK
ncbi:hypothetical protein NA78x_001282 [Anatilimnocola sp. NA78]|uniref:hypothetical protein n=1 Tax=Anatilimnocola sp. NA78 TaxID=3415683 RepID=UPI003CE4BA88